MKGEDTHTHTHETSQLFSLQAQYVFFSMCVCYIYVIYREGGPYGKNCARGLFGFLLFEVGKEIYRRHLVQSLFLRIIKFAFTVCALIRIHFP